MQVEKERNLEDSVQLTKQTKADSKKISASVPNHTANSHLAKQKNIPTSTHPNKNNVFSSTKKKAKAPPAPTSRVSPQHQPRLNPFNEDVEEEAEQINNRNPFEDPNPFTQTESNPFENGPTNPFDEPVHDLKTPEAQNPFSNMNGVVEHEDVSSDIKSNEINYEVRKNIL